jgi:hypothetical protein
LRQIKNRRIRETVRNFLSEFQTAA